MSEPIKIEPFYQAQAKQIADCLFDKGFLSESLSRDGMDAIEELLAFYLQTDAKSAAKCAEMTKKYKAHTAQREGEDPARSEEEMRWIARCWKAEGRVRELEGIFDSEEKAEEAWKWGRKVGDLLKKALEPPFGFSGRESFMEASCLFNDAIKLGIIPEPDCRPGQVWEVRSGDGCACSPEAHYPGQVIPGVCPKCGGRKI